MQITFPGPDIYLQSKVFPVSTMTTLLNAAKIQKFEVKHHTLSLYESDKKSDRL